MKNLNGNKGVFFIAALGIMFLLMNLGLAYLFILRTESNIYENQFQAVRALYYAESGLEHAIAEILDDTDPDGDGVGTIPPMDIDGDSFTDYYALYNDVSKIVTAYGTVQKDGVPSEGATRQVQAKVALDSRWTGAWQIGNNITLNAPAGGTINGNIDAVGTIHPNIGLYTVNGTVTASNSELQIPVPSFADYANPANFPAQNHYTWPDCSGLQLTPPDGIYYINGNCVRNFGTTGPFSLNGTIIATGDISIQGVTGSFTITPVGDQPAIVAGNDFVLTSMNNVRLNGLVYAGRDIRFTTFAFLTQVTNGSLVAGRDFVLTNVSNSLMTFDDTKDPPFFTGGGSGGVIVSEWRGH